MVTCEKILSLMERIAPKSLAEEWDNVGLLVGSPRQEIKKILVCLDVSEAVIAEAIDIGANLILSHHPLIFRPLKSLRTDTPLGNRLQKLLINDIAAIAAHTNLDTAWGGVNDVLAAKLELTEVKPLDKSATEENPGLGRIGILAEPMEIDDFAAMVRKNLNADGLRVVKGNSAVIKKVALCSGSGAEFIDRAVFRKADAFVTGDVRYHDAQRAAELGLTVLDAGHFATEYPIVDVLAKKLAAELPEVAVGTATGEKDFLDTVQ